MFHKLSIRIRLVGVTMLILIICCIGITFIINYSATQMTSQVVDIFVPAKELTPTQTTETDDNASQVQPSQLDVTPAVETTKAEEQAQIMKSFYKNSILYMLFIIGLGTIMMYFFSKKILLPLATLNGKIKSSTISNLMDKVAVPNSHDEITELAISFNKMTDGIHEALLFQQQFSANVAHELRTPLTILKTKIEVFNKRDSNNIVEYKQLISGLQKQISRLSDIVQTLLKLTNTDVIKEKEYMSLSDIVDTIMEDLSTLATQKQIQFFTNVQDIEVFGDIDSIYQVFYNLIQNSIKYNVDKGSVSISATYENNTTIIKLCDTGLGIASEHKKHIFEPFFCVDPSRSRSVGGVGLGLSIVKNIVEKHDGSISVMDDSPQGTCFVIELPFPKQVKSL